MNSVLLYNIPHEESFGAFIGLYIFFTGLSAGSFFLSTLAYGFGQKTYRALSRPAIVAATAMLVMAPGFLLLHVGQPLRFWHLFIYLNPSSPITWGSFLLTSYPIFCFVYMYTIFRENEQAARISGLIGIPFAISVHAYTGFILAFCAARPMWHSSMVPLLFLVSAIVSGTALMIMVFAFYCRFRGESIFAFTDNGRLLLSLGRVLGWILLVDLLLTVAELLVEWAGWGETRWAVKVLLSGQLFFYFVVIELLLGKVVPLFLLFNPRLRSINLLFVASALIIIGILFMRLDLIHVGELLPLI